MSDNYGKIKVYYENYLTDRKPRWDKQKVYNAVGKWITAEEYKEITGEEYR